MEFLDLDNLKPGKNINMKRRPRAPGDENKFTIPLMPMCLIPLADYEKVARLILISLSAMALLHQLERNPLAVKLTLALCVLGVRNCLMFQSKVPLLSRTGEPIGKKDDFYVNTCFLHPAGPLLLDPANEHFIHAAADPIRPYVAL